MPIMKSAWVQVMLVALLAAVAFAAIAGARPATKRKFASTYSEARGTKLDACVTCHTGTTTDLNAYGEDLRSAETDFEKVEKADSDGDGSRNVDEIKALSFPGDPKDKPAVRADSTGKVGSDSTVAKPDSSGTAEPDSARHRVEPEKPRDGGGKPRFPWSPGFTGIGEPVELLAAHDTP
jgi:hypothetical protein